MKLTAAGLTDVGRLRPHNEDALLCAVDAGLFLVADGMGGRAAGETASRVVVTALPGMLEAALSAEGGESPEKAGPAIVKRALRESLSTLSAELFHQSQGVPTLAGLGAAVVALLVRDGVGHVAWAGDCRAYLFRGSRLWQVTEDQTTGAALVRTGFLRADALPSHPLRHALEEYIGKEGRLRPKTRHRKLESRDRWLCCSDGLVKGLDDRALRDLLRGPGEPAATCERLVAAANAADGTDNITVIVVDVT